MTCSSSSPNPPNIVLSYGNISSSPSAQRSKFATTASALKSVPSWNVIPSSNSNVYSKPSSDTSHSFARPGSTAVPSSSNSNNVSKMIFVTLNVSPSVVRDGSKDVESPPRPKTSVPPLPSPSSTSASLSASASSLLPEQAANIRPTKSNKDTNKDLLCFAIM